MGKIIIEEYSETGQPDGSHWYPFFDFLATKGVFPKYGNYPENKDVFLHSMNGTECLIKGQVSLKEIKETFEFRNVVRFNTERAAIYDVTNSIFFYINFIDEDSK